MKTKIFFEMIGLFIFFTIIIIPGLLFMDTFFHEYYHYIKHKENAIELCFDFNKASQGHLGILVPSNSTEGIDPEQIKQEDKTANLIGKIASLIYFLIVILTVIWISHVMTRIEKK
jgi:hypothetical protein